MYRLLSQTQPVGPCILFRLQHVETFTIDLSISNYSRQTF